MGRAHRFAGEHEDGEEEADEAEYFEGEEQEACDGKSGGYDQSRVLTLTAIIECGDAVHDEGRRQLFVTR